MTAAKKVLLGVAALVVVAGVGGFAAMQVMRQRIVTDVEKQFDGLRTVLARAEHGAVDFDPWSRTVRIADIRLVPKHVAVDRAVTIASVTAHGAASVDDAVSADRLDFQDIVGNIPFFEQPGTEAKHTVPSVAVEGFAMHMVTPAPPTANAAVRLLRALSAKSVTVPKFMISAAVTVPQIGAKAGQPPVTARIEQTQFDSRIEDLRDGRVGKFNVGRVEMTMPMQPPLGGDLKVEMRDLYTTGYDIGALLAVVSGDVAGNAPAGPLTLSESAGIGSVTGKIDKVTTFDLAGATMGKVTADAARLGPAWQAFKGMQAAAVAGSRAMTPPASVFETLADVYESIGMTAFEYRGLVVEAQGMAPFKLGRVAIDQYEKGVIGKLSVDDVDAPLPTKQRYQLKHFGLTSLNMGQLLRLSGRVGAGGGSSAAQSQQMWEALKLMQGFEVDGLEYPDTDTRRPVQIERLAVDWGSFIGRLPLAGRFEMKASIPVGSNTKGMFAVLAPTGLDTLAIAHRGAWSWQEQAQSLMVGPIDLTMPGLGEYSTQVRLEGITRQMLTLPPELLPLAMAEMRVGPIKLALRDTGLTKLLTKDLAFEEKHRQLLLSLKTPDQAGAAEPAELAEIKAGVVRFLENPGERLVIEMKPKAPISLTDVLAGGKSGTELLMLLAARMNTSVTVSPVR